MQLIKTFRFNDNEIKKKYNISTIDGYPLKHVLKCSI